MIFNLNIMGRMLLHNLERFESYKAYVLSQRHLAHVFIWIAKDRDSLREKCPLVYVDVREFRGPEHTRYNSPLEPEDVGLLKEERRCAIRVTPEFSLVELVINDQVICSDEIMALDVDADYILLSCERGQWINNVGN